MAKHAPQTIEDFLGEWRLRRDIVDVRTSQVSHMVGTAELTHSGKGFAYGEIGKLTIGEAPALTATRRYLWHRAEEGQGIDVFFEDGRPFHAIDLTMTMPHAEHLCAPDLYHVTYDFRQWPDWRVEWRVVGPRKDYRLTTRLSRQDAQPLHSASVSGIEH